MYTRRRSVLTTVSILKRNFSKILIGVIKMIGPLRPGRRQCLKRATFRTYSNVRKKFAASAAVKHFTFLHALSMSMYNVHLYYYAARQWCILLQSEEGRLMFFKQEKKHGGWRRGARRCAIEYLSLRMISYVSGFLRGTTFPPSHRHQVLPSALFSHVFPPLSHPAFLSHSGSFGGHNARSATRKLQWNKATLMAQS